MARTRKSEQIEVVVQNDLLLGQDQLRYYLGGISVKTLYKDFLNNGLKPFASIGKQNWYLKKDVLQFLKDHNQWQEPCI